MATTFDPAFIRSNAATLSSGNRLATFTHSAFDSSPGLTAWANCFIPAGAKAYFEIVIDDYDATNYFQGGVAQKPSVYDGDYQNQGSASPFANQFNTYDTGIANGDTGTLGATASIGSVLRVLVDRSTTGAATIQFAIDGGAFISPAHIPDIDLTPYAAFGPYHGQTTINGTSAQFSYSIPSGFSALNAVCTYTSGSAPAWDAGFKDSYATLSNANRTTSGAWTLDQANAINQGFGSSFLPAGSKAYFEFLTGSLVGTLANDGSSFGVADRFATFDAATLPDHSATINNANGDCYFYDPDTATTANPSLGPINAGDTIRIKLDYSGASAQISVAINGGAFTSPATIGAFNFYPYYSVGIGTQSLLLRTASADFAYSIPSGFSAWDELGTAPPAPDPSHGSGALTLGDATISAHGSVWSFAFSASADTSLSSPSVEASARDGLNGADISLEALTIDAYAGARADIALEGLQTDIAAFYPNIASFNGDIGALQIDAAATPGWSATADFYLSSLELSGQAGASADFSLAPLELSSSARPGWGAAAEFALQSLEIESLASANWTANAELDLLALETQESFVADFELAPLSIASSVVDTQSLAPMAWSYNLLHRSDLYGPGLEPAINQASRFPGFNMQALHRVGGRYYLVSSDGIHLFEGSTDNGAPISWRTKTGYSDFKAQPMKVMRQVMVGGRVTNKLTATVWAAEYGGKETPFPQTTPRSNDPRNLRITCGRGIRARYLALELSNTNGDEAIIDSVNLLVQTTGRAI